MNNFSVNMLKTFESCPAKFYFKYIQRISIPQKSSFFDKGKKIHALANYYLKGDNIDKLETTLTEEEAKTWLNLKNNTYFQKQYVSSEYNISCKIGDFWVGGRLDALVCDNNDYYILDYKTGSIPKNPESDYQTIVYLLCADKLLKNYNSLNFVYIDLKNNRNYEIRLSKETQQIYENKINMICEKISNYLYCEAVEHHKKCEFCEYNKICF